MNQQELDALAIELMDGDLPSMSSISYKGQTFNASLSKGYVETGRISGVRSILLCPNVYLDGAKEGDQIFIDNDAHYIQGFDVRGKAMTALILGRGSND